MNWRSVMLALMEQVVAPLDSLTTALEQQRKALSSRLERIQRDHKSASDAVRRAMQRYHDASAAASTASPNDAAAALEKVRALRVDYVAAVDAARLAHVVYYENELPALLREAQQTQTSFGVVVARTLSIYSKIGRAVPDARSGLLLAIDGVVQSVEIDLDLVQFAELHRSNTKIPPPPSLIEPDSAEASVALAAAAPSRRLLCRLVLRRRLARDSRIWPAACSARPRRLCLAVRATAAVAATTMAKQCLASTWRSILLRVHTIRWARRVTVRWRHGSRCRGV
jgi:hypothetical protein